MPIWNGWYLRTESNLSGKFSFPMALPFATSFSTGDVVEYLLEIGASAGITNSQLHNDYIGIDASNAVGAMAVGGSYSDGDKAGRYTSQFYFPTSSSSTQVGFRCAIQVEKDDYDTGSDVHSYSY